MSSLHTEIRPAAGAKAIPHPAIPNAVTPPEVQLPDYLRKHYAWAYVWPFSVWFFDHQPIINAILFGNYRRIMRSTLRLMEPETAGRTLQVAAVYGELTPTLARNIDDLHVIDAAPIQLRSAWRKLSAIGRVACCCTSCPPGRGVNRSPRRSACCVPVAAS